MVEYKYTYQYFNERFALIARGFSINEFKNIFNATPPQFLEDDKEYNRKTAYRTFKENYNWVMDKLIERIHGYAKLWIISCRGSNYRIKYLHGK